MKQYSKPQMMAKNAPSGSYAAGCPAEHTYNSGMFPQCQDCERSH